MKLETALVIKLKFLCTRVDGYLPRCWCHDYQLAPQIAYY